MREDKCFASCFFDVVFPWYIKIIEGSNEVVSQYSDKYEEKKRDNKKEDNLTNQSRVFVAAWDYPPIISGESVVCKRTLEASSFNFDVCCGPIKGTNEAHISLYPIQGNKYLIWPFAVARKFSQMNRKNHYAVMMSRVMPPNGHLAGWLIKRICPRISRLGSRRNGVNRDRIVIRHRNRIRAICLCCSICCSISIYVRRKEFHSNKSQNHKHHTKADEIAKTSPAPRPHSL